MVYEKGGLIVFKNFLFITQLFVVPSLNVTTTNDLGCVQFFFYYVATFKNKCCDKVLQSLVDKVSQMSRHCKKCCDIISDAHFNLCRNIKCSFQIESKFIYVATQRNYVATLNFNFRIATLSVFTQDTFKTRCIHSYPSEHTCEDSFNHQRPSIQV